MGHAWNRSDNKKAFIEGLSWLGEAAGVDCCVAVDPLFGGVGSIDW
jgi:hypothetical protein